MHLIQKSAVLFSESLVTSFTLVIYFLIWILSELVGFCSLIDFEGRGESCKLSIHMILCHDWWYQQFAPIDKYLPVCVFVCVCMCARIYTCMLVWKCIGE